MTTTDPITAAQHALDALCLDASGFVQTMHDPLSVAVAEYVSRTANVVGRYPRADRMDASRLRLLAALMVRTADGIDAYLEAQG